MPILTLGANGKAALNLALAQIATGDWQAAQATLTAMRRSSRSATAGWRWRWPAIRPAAIAMLTERRARRARMPRCARIWR